VKLQRRKSAKAKPAGGDLQRVAHCGTQSTCQNLFSETTEHSRHMHHMLRYNSFGSMQTFNKR